MKSVLAVSVVFAVTPLTLAEAGGKGAQGPAPKVTYHIEMECNGKTQVIRSDSPSRGMTEAMKGGNPSTCFLSRFGTVEAETVSDFQRATIDEKSWWGALSVTATKVRRSQFGAYWNTRTEDRAKSLAHEACVSMSKRFGGSDCVTRAYRGGYVVGVRCEHAPNAKQGTIGIGNAETVSEAFAAALLEAAQGKNPGYCEVKGVIHTTHGNTQGPEWLFLSKAK